MEDGSNRVERIEERTAVGLHVRNVPGILTVRVWDADVMRVRMVGASELVVKTERRVDNGVLHIVGPRPGAYDRLEVVVDVPRITPVTIRDVFAGVYHVGDTEGPLNVRLGEAAKVTAGRVGATELLMKSFPMKPSPMVDIAEVVGDHLIVTVKGTGKVAVRRGEVVRLAVNARSRSEVAFGGRAETAELVTAQGAQLMINEITGPWTKDDRNGGTIYVHTAGPSTSLR